MIVRLREIAEGKDERIRQRGKSEGRRREAAERERVQQRCHLNAADVIPKISNNNSRR